MSTRTTKLISASTVFRITMIRSSVDNDTVNANILLAQDTQLSYVIGKTFVDKLKEVKFDPAKDEADGRYQKLMDDFVDFYLSWATAWCCLPQIQFAIGQNGINKKESNQGTSTFESETSYIKGNINNGVNSYKKLMLQFLCENSSKFPEFNAPNRGQQKAIDDDTIYNGIQL